MTYSKTVRDMSGKFTFQPDEAGMFEPDIFLPKCITFLAPILSGNSNLLQGNIGEF